MKLKLKPKSIRQQADGQLVAHFYVTDEENSLGGSETIMANGRTIEELAASLAPKIKAATELFEERGRLLAIAEAALKLARK